MIWAELTARISGARCWRRLSWMGLRKSEASELFRISRNTIDQWFKRREQTGNVAASTVRPPSVQRKIKDLAVFRQLVRQNPVRTQAELAVLWDGEVSQRMISRVLKQIGFSRKKLMGIVNVMRRPVSNFKRHWAIQPPRIWSTLMNPAWMNGMTIAMVGHRLVNAFRP